MQITRQADYAIRAVIALAKNPPGTLMQVKDIAQKQEIGAAFLNKIIQILAKEKIVVTVRGSQGGITLARPASEITLREVVEAIDGPIVLNKCLMGKGICSRDGFCKVHQIWHEAQTTLFEKLEAVTFDQLHED